MREIYLIRYRNSIGVSMKRYVLGLSFSNAIEEAHLNELPQQQMLSVELLGKVYNG